MHCCCGLAFHQLIKHIIHNQVYPTQSNHNIRRYMHDWIWFLPQAMLCGFILLSCLIIGGDENLAGAFLGNLGSSVFVDSTKHSAMADSFGALYGKWEETCKAQNMVLPRNDSLGIKLPALQPWSLNELSFQGGGKLCASLEDLLLAVKQGRRVLWDTGQSASHQNNEREATVTVDDDSMNYQEAPSYFVPHGCRLNLFDDIQACDILNNYSHVVFMGDSLGRHAAQGLMMMLTRDLVLGSFPRTTKKTTDIMDRCRCDGQFSGSILCRTYDIGHLLPINPRDNGLCSHLTGKTFALHYVNLGGPKHALDGPVWQSLCSNDTRPILVLLNGGLHYRLDPSLIKSILIDGITERIRNISNSCEWTLEFKVTWTGVHAQSRRLDGLYPRQTRENAAIFNEEVDEYASTRYGMIPVNFLNLTKDAQTSDGLHSLSDVNIYKANVLLHVANLLQREK